MSDFGNDIRRFLDEIHGMDGLRAADARTSADLRWEIVAAVSKMCDQLNELRRRASDHGLVRVVKEVDAALALIESIRSLVGTDSYAELLRLHTQLTDVTARLAQEVP